MKKNIIKIFLFFLFLSQFSTVLSATSTPTPKPTPDPIILPEDIEGAKKMGEKAWKAIPESLEEAWNDAVIIWQKMAEHIKNFWDLKIKPILESFWKKIEKEILIRKPIIEEEFEKEKKEMKEDIESGAPKAGKNLWERFRELIK